MKKQVKDLKKIKKQLRGSAKMHKAQADKIDSVIKVAGKYMEKKQCHSFINLNKQLRFKTS